MHRHTQTDKCRASLRDIAINMLDCIDKVSEFKLMSLSD